MMYKNLMNLKTALFLQHANKYAYRMPEYIRIWKHLEDIPLRQEFVMHGLSGVRVLARWP